MKVLSHQLKTKQNKNKTFLIGELPDDLPEMSEDEDDDEDEEMSETMADEVQGQDSFEVTNSLMSADVSNMPESSSDAKHK